MLAVDLEAPQNVKNGYYGNIYSGYFKAPATARYKFYMSCDDSCQIHFSRVSKDPTQKAQILQVDVVGYRSYLALPNVRQTSWLNLTKDEYYYIEVRHIQYTGADHLTVAVEIEDPDIVPGHHHTQREIQRLSLTQTLIRDSLNITITGLDGGNFVLVFTNPKDSSTWSSSQISTNGTANDLYQAIRTYYSNVWGAPISVVKTMYDENDTVTTSQPLSVKNVFTVKVTRSLPQASVNTLQVQKVSTRAAIQLLLPKNYELSSLPLKGNFKIKCYLWDGVTPNTTLDIAWNASPSTIRDRIAYACPNYREKIEVWDSGYYYYEDARDFFIRYVGLN